MCKISHSIALHRHRPVLGTRPWHSMTSRLSWAALCQPLDGASVLHGHGRSTPSSSEHKMIVISKYVTLIPAGRSEFIAEAIRGYMSVHSSTRWKLGTTSSTACSVLVFLFFFYRWAVPWRTILVNAWTARLNSRLWYRPSDELRSTHKRGQGEDII